MKPSTINFPRTCGVAALLLAAGFLAGRVSSTPGRATDAGMPRPEARSAPGGSVSHGSARSGDAGSHRSGPETTPASWDDRWRNLQGLPAGAAREKSMAEALRELATTDPQAALALARQETNVRARQLLIEGALRGWASVDPGGSVGWAEANLFETERRSAVAAIIEGGLARREETMRAIEALSARDAAQGDDYGRMLIAALAGNSDFETALKFATESSSSHRDYWTSSALYSWSQYQPQEAAAALTRITDPVAHNEAMHGLILGWSSNDPASLARFAMDLPAGPARREALNQALQNWVTHDPVAASDWLNQHQSNPEFDSGAMKLATNPYLVTNNIESALGWAGSVSDPEQRSIALVDIIQQWALRDPAAARRYAESRTDLQSGYRTMLMKDLDAGADP